MKEYFHIQNPFVILPVDELTGGIILRPDFNVCIKGEKKPIQKKEGFHIFMGLRNIQVTVYLSGKGYQEETVTIDRSLLDGKNPVVKIFMKPDKEYSFPPGTFYMEGTLPEGAVLTVAATQGGTFRKLLSDIDAGDTYIEIFQKQEENLEGTIYYASETTASAMEDESFEKRVLSGEWMELEQREERVDEIPGGGMASREKKTSHDSGIYRLKTPVNGNLKKRNIRLYPAVRRYAGGVRTSYFIAVRGNRKDEDMQIVCCLMTKDKQEIQELTLNMNKTRYLDF